MYTQYTLPTNSNYDICELVLTFIRKTAIPVISLVISSYL